MLGLPDQIEACLFDLEGVLTQTATVHAAAWKSMFDAFLEDRARSAGEPFRSFDDVRDYDEYVDARRHSAGARPPRATLPGRPASMISLARAPNRERGGNARALSGTRGCSSCLRCLPIALANSA